MSKNGKPDKMAKVDTLSNILNDAAPKKKDIRNQPGKCVGCGNEPDEKTAENHKPVVLVTESQLDRSKDGKLHIRCIPCEIEYKRRERNSKSILAFRESIWKIDEVVPKAQEYQLTQDQVDLLKSEREYCLGEIQKAFVTEKEVQDFIGQ